MKIVFIRSQRLKNVLYSLIFSAAILNGCNAPSSHQQESTTGLPQDSIVSLSRQAYIYGYPIVVMYQTMRSATNIEAPEWNNAFAPTNQFGHFRTFPDAKFKAVVKPNCDTYYSSAWLDLSGDPMVLTVPDTHDRYYLMPMLDAYTNVFASPGKRTTGTKAGTYLVTGPSFNGTVPSEMKQIKAPTSMVWLLGRTQVNSSKDGKEVVHRIQDGYKLTPLSKWGSKYTPEKHTVDTSISKTPPAFVEEMDISEFFNTLNELMTKNPPPAEDSVILRKLALINVGAGMKFDAADYDSTTRKMLQSVPKAVHQGLRDAAIKAGTLESNWNVTRSGVGSYGTQYGMRALVAMIGLGANLNADASYPNCQLDNFGAKLDGSKKYVIHFDKGQTPPAHAFWSLTMYGPDELLVDNPINRYTIGDRDKLKFNADGSLDVYVQHERPSKDKESNWLPAPKSGFSVTMRLYWPKDEFLNGTWKITPVAVATN